MTQYISLKDIVLRTFEELGLKDDNPEKMNNIHMLP